ncbi:PREDICTED: dimethylaniline monooxygenase [N-oxide-forming] 5-like, partial [Buceros rhinoceros silvestris]|uniref:dimethylaniline monooxygenase [N-oxide-forming] 5-like n=1 Tax=Buceros rhinoceros silvestris TaxID=175836 RepID=UPI00052809A7
RFLEQHPTINDDLPNCIISGRVLVKPNVREFTETSAVFEDGTREDIDAVVFATGYSFSFPFLEGCVKVVENQIPLYKFMFPPDLEKPTLAFIGLIQPLGAIMPIAELQCRWATRVFKGLNELPPRHDMEADIKQKRDAMAKRHLHPRLHPGTSGCAKRLRDRQRIIKPLQTRSVEEQPAAPALPLVFKLVGAVAVLAVIFAY